MNLFAQSQSAETFNVVEAAEGGQIAALLPGHGFVGEVVTAVAVGVELENTLVGGLVEKDLIQRNGKGAFPAGGAFDSAESLTEGLYNLYATDIVNCINNGLNATVLTQVSDVEDETNGIVTYDRKVIKTNSTKMQEMAKMIFDAFDKKVK